MKVVVKAQEDSSKGTLFRVSQQVCIPPIFKALVFLSRTYSGLNLIQSHFNTAKTRAGVSALEIMNFSHGCPFHVLLKNVLDYLVKFPKQIMVYCRAITTQCVVRTMYDDKVE